MHEVLLSADRHLFHNFQHTFYKKTHKKHNCKDMFCKFIQTYELKNSLCIYHIILRKETQEMFSCISSRVNAKTERLESGHGFEPMALNLRYISHQRKRCQVWETFAKNGLVQAERYHTLVTTLSWLERQDSMLDCLLNFSGIAML